MGWENGCRLVDDSWLAGPIVDADVAPGPARFRFFATPIGSRSATPGHSLKSEEALGEPGSEARNPKIAAVLAEGGR